MWADTRDLSGLSQSITMTHAFSLRYNYCWCFFVKKNQLRQKLSINIIEEEFLPSCWKSRMFVQLSVTKCFVGVCPIVFLCRAIDFTFGSPLHFQSKIMGGLSLSFYLSLSGFCFFVCFFFIYLCLNINLSFILFLSFSLSDSEMQSELTYFNGSCSQTLLFDTLINYWKITYFVCDFLSNSFLIHFSFLFFRFSSHIHNALQWSVTWIFRHH